VSKRDIYLARKAWFLMLFLGSLGLWWILQKWLGYFGAILGGLIVAGVYFFPSVPIGTPSKESKENEDLQK
jgi:hypothetical protein